MMYYAAFVPGLQRVAADIVRTRLSDVRIDKLLDGAIVFETQCTYDRLNFFCFNNIFAVVSIIENPHPEAAIEYHMKVTLRQDRNPVIAENNGKIQSFRLVFSDENRLVPVDEKIKRALEKHIAAQAQLRIDRSRPDTEFWFLYRREGFSVFMKRLTKHPPFEKALRPGELPPPLAYMLCRLSDPKGGQVAVDPFCGYGSILEARQKYFPPALFYASDIDKKVIAAAERRITGSLSPLCHVQKLDVRDIFSVVPEGAADAIITDPPWGIHAGLPVPAGRFYEDIAGIFGRLLKPGGTAVVLTARAGELKVGAEKSGVLELKETLPVLVSGRKASVLCLKKTETNRRDKKEGTESAGQGFC